MEADSIKHEAESAGQDGDRPGAAGLASLRAHMGRAKGRSTHGSRILAVRIHPPKHSNRSVTMAGTVLAPVLAQQGHFRGYSVTNSPARG